MRNFKLISVLFFIAALLTAFVLYQRLNKPSGVSAVKSTLAEVINKNSTDNANRSYDANYADSSSPDLGFEKKVENQIKNDEIKSLKQSIQNDKKLLAEIEQSGTGLAEYKWIETNLAKRKKRLELLKNQK